MEGLSSNLSLIVTVDFDFETDYSFLMISFSEPSTAPPEIEVWIDGNLMSSFIIDKFIVSAVPPLSANQNFTVDITNYLNPSTEITPSCFITVLSEGIDGSNIAQQVLALESSQSFSETIKTITIIESNKNFDLFASISLNLVFITYDLEPKAGQVIRLVLPKDFPPNYFFEKMNINCTLQNMGFTQNTTILTTCSMRGINVNVKLGSDMTETDYSELHFALSISGIYSSSNYGKCGDFQIFFYDDTSKSVQAINYKTWDFYENPIVIQSLNQISLTLESDNQPIYYLSLLKGTKRAIFLRTDQIVFIIFYFLNIYLIFLLIIFYQGFRNEINVTISLFGNSDISILNPNLNIYYGDLYAIFNLSVRENATYSKAFVRFTKTEKDVIKYENIYPLQLEISYNTITIEVPNKISLYPGGKTVFLEIYVPNPLNNINITININSSSSNLEIIGSKSLTLNESISVNTFRLGLKNGSNTSLSYSLTYTLIGTYASYFELSSEKTSVNLLTKPKDLVASSLTFKGSLNIYTHGIQLIITNYNYPHYIYYQIYEETSGNASALEMTMSALIEKMDASIDEEIFETNRTFGIIDCNDISDGGLCTRQINNLKYKKHYLLAYAVHPAGIQGITPLKTSFQPNCNFFFYSFKYVY